MTYRSYLWDGSTGGDAIYAPYNKDEFNFWFSGTDQAAENGAWVIPGIYEDLYPHVSTYSQLTVSPGAARINNYLFISDQEKNFLIESNLAANQHRFDRLVLRVNTATQTVRLDIIRGTESASYPPTPPTLTQTDLIWEEELALIYIDSDSFTLDSDHLYDRRRFLRTWWSTTQFPNKQLLMNSEFMSIGIVPYSPFNVMASGWIQGGGLTGYYYQNIKGLSGTPVRGGLMPMVRGNALDVTNGRVYASVKAVSNCKTYTLRGLIQVLAYGMQIHIQGYDATDGEAYDDLKFSFYHRVSSEPEDFCYTITFPREVETILIEYTSLPDTDGSQFYLGQQIFVAGYHPGSYRMFHGTEMLRHPLTDTSWDGDAKSDQTTTISNATSFLLGTDPGIPLGTKAIILRVKIRDSAGLGTTAYLEIRTISGITLARVDTTCMRTDDWTERQVIVPVDSELRELGADYHRFVVYINASAAGTMDVYLEVVGIIT